MISQELYDKLHKKEFDEARKEPKDYTFTNILELWKKEDSKKPSRIKELERNFYINGDIAHIISDGIRNSFFDDKKIDELIVEFVKLSKRFNKVSASHEEYANFSWDSHPDYLKFVEYFMSCIHKLGRSIHDKFWFEN